MDGNKNGCAAYEVAVFAMCCKVRLAILPIRCTTVPSGDAIRTHKAIGTHFAYGVS